MTTSLRWTAPLTAVAVTLAVLAVARPDWVCFDPMPSAGRASILLSGPPEESRLLQKRIDWKNSVADRLVDGELTLAEAAAWFRYLNENPPHFQTEYRSVWPGDSDGEKLCRQVIGWVRARLYPTRPASEIEVLTIRLEEQLCALLAQGDAVELPW
jgi:hypothetical protein